MQRAMRQTCLLLVVLAASLPLYASADSSISAVQKVVKMLANMNAKAMKEKQNEEVAFASFKTWCLNEQSNLDAAIKKSAEEIDSVSAQIGKLGSDSKVLGQEISQLQQDVAKYSADLEAQKNQREKDHKGFQEEQKDYGESVDALERAIAILSKQNYDRTALVQLSESQQLPGDAQNMVSAFLGMLGDDKQDPLSVTAPEAAAYEFQSSSIVDMLKKLKDEFVDKKSDCEKEEMNSRHAFDMLAQDLASSAETANEDISAKSLKKTAKDGKRASLTKQLTSAQAVKAEDEQTLSDTTVECREKKMSFDEKQQLRTEEIQALAQAIDILSREEVQGAAVKHLSLAQLGAKRALVQTLRGASATDSEGIRLKVREFLESEGSRLHSKHLELLAQKLASDPFAKVKKMIDEMITRLLEESHADADHEGFCNKELGESKITRAKLSETIDSLTADIEGGKATITQLTQDVANLSKELAQIDASVQEATELRVAEKATNEATAGDAKEAQKALEAAMSVLKEFYAKASVATAFVQLKSGKKTVTAMPTTEWGNSGGSISMGSEEWKAMANPGFEGKVDLGHKEGMQTFGDTYQGQQDEAGGVMAMLEVILSDFATLKANTESDEALSQQTYNEFMAESKKEKAIKSRKVELNTADKISAEGKMRDDTADLKFAQDKLLAAERYYDKLKPQCVDVGMTYDERTKARAGELQSLKDALKILQGEDIAF